MCLNKKYNKSQQRTILTSQMMMILWYIEEFIKVLTYILNKTRSTRSYTETEIIVKAFSSFVFFQGLIKEMGLQQIYGLFKEL